MVPLAPAVRASKRGEEMTTIRIVFEPDSEDGNTPHAVDLDTDAGARFFVVWLGPGGIEWINTDDEYPGGPYFGGLQRCMEESE